jgi:hypothetical protein
MIMISGNRKRIAARVKAYIATVGWTEVDFAFKVAARQREFMRVSVSTEVAGDKNLELFVASAQTLDEFSEIMQCPGAMAKQAIEQWEVV